VTRQNKNREKKGRKEKIKRKTTMQMRLLNTTNKKKGEAPKGTGAVYF
jgi:hypothetical protein